MKKPIRTDAFIFRWKVKEAGYQWAKGIMDGKPHLVSRTEPGMWIKEYEPPKGLFAEFAALKPIEKDIKAFADKYGDLFEDSYGSQDHTREGQGASLQRWQAEIGEMRVFVDLWGQIRNRQTSELRNIITWSKTKSGHKQVGYTIKTPARSRSKPLAHSLFSESDLRPFVEGDVLLPARYALQEEINLRLAEHPTVPRLAWTPDYDQRIIFRPPNLLAAMWLRFAQTVTGEFQLTQCEVCHGYFQVGPGGRRTDSTTCGNACRQAKWNKEHGKSKKSLR
jgi:hypothetical protein